ncbi:MAG: hypothetical protein ACE5IM_02110 [Nitrospinota bacterium]
MKTLAAGLAALLALAAPPPGARAQEETGDRRPESADGSRKIVIEYRDGTRQEISLEKDWWEILNIRLPAAPAPPSVRTPAEGLPGPGTARSTAAPKKAGLDVSGRWVNWRQDEKQVFTMSLVQTGKRVRGLYRMDPRYVIDGTLEGSVLQGTWSSLDDVGEFIFEFSEDGRSFVGRWNSTKDLKNWNLGWNGRRP